MIWGSIPVRAHNFLQNVQFGSGAHPGYDSMSTRRVFSAVKRPGRKAGHSPPSSADDKNERSYPMMPDTPSPAIHQSLGSH